MPCPRSSTSITAWNQQLSHAACGIHRVTLTFSIELVAPGRNAALPVLQELEERLFLWTVVQPMDSQDPCCYAQEDLEDM